MRRSLEEPNSLRAIAPIMQLVLRMRAGTSPLSGNSTPSAMPWQKPAFEAVDRACAHRRLRDVPRDPVARAAPREQRLATGSSGLSRDRRGLRPCQLAALCPIRAHVLVKIGL